MGTCASIPCWKAEGNAGKDTYILPTGVSVPQRYMVATPENGKRNTADVITNAFLVREGRQSEAAGGIAARLASRMGVEDRRGSSIAINSVTGSLPASDSFANRPLDGSIAKEGASRNVMAPIAPSEDSFELSRMETVKRLANMQKSFKAGVSPIWAFSAKRLNPSEEADTAGGGSLGPSDGRRRNQPEGFRGSGSRASGNGRDIDGEVDGNGWRGTAEEEEVVPMDKSICVGPNAAAALVVATEPDVLGDMGLIGDAFMTAGVHDSVRRSERSGTPRRDDEYGSSCFRTVSISRMHCPYKVAVPDEGGGGGDAKTGANGGGGGGGNTDAQTETDELTSLPLPNMVTEAPETRRVALRQVLESASTTGHRMSAMPYVQQESRRSLDIRAASRNSDLGYYLEEARFASSSLPQGAQPVRHNLMDSPMVRQRAAQAGKEAEEAARPAPVVLDYVPAIKSQPSRSNLLMAQPCIKQRPTGGGSVGGPLEDDEGDSGIGTASRRLEYAPNKSLSRKFSHATLPSGSLLLVTAGGSSSRPMSPVSRYSLASPRAGDGNPGSPQTLEGESERCFHVTRTGVGVATAGVSNSASLPSAGVGMSPLSVARRSRMEAERRISSSASQVPLGPAAMLLQQPPQPAMQSPTLPLAGLRSMTSNEASRRGSRSMIASSDIRPAEPQFSSPTPSRLQKQSSGSAVAAVVPGRWGAGHDVIGSATWSGISPAAQHSASIPRARADLGGEPNAGGSIGMVHSAGGASRAADRAARVLATVQRMGVSTPEVSAVQ